MSLHCSVVGYLSNYRLQCDQEMFASALRSRPVLCVCIGVKDIRDVIIYQNPIYLSKRYSCELNCVFNVNNAIVALQKFGSCTGVATVE